MAPAGRDDITSDPDVTHLLDLLRMLPGPTEDRDFWASVQSVWRGEGFPAEATSRNLDYVYGKMTHLARFLRDPQLDTLRYLCQYLLVFFGTGNTDMCRVLSRVTALDFSIDSTDGGTGQLWAEDVTRTAWLLLVKYPRQEAGDWREKWRFERDTTGDWMADQDGV